MSARNRRGEIDPGNIFHMPSDAAPAPQTTLSEADQALYGELSKIDSRLVTVNSDGTMRLGNFSLTSTGLVPHGKIDQDEWEYVGTVIKRLNDSIQWLIGDWIAYGVERKWGDTYKEVALKYGYHVQTVRTFFHVCSRVKVLIRINTLSFNHHRLVARFKLEDGSPDVDEQRYWLQCAASGNWSISQMRDEINGKPTPPLPDVIVSRKFDKKYHELKREIHGAKPAEIPQMKMLLLELLDELERRG